MIGADPSPIVQVTRSTLAVTVTVTPPSEALPVAGPYVRAVGFLTHIQFGSPTTPMEVGSIEVGVGAMPMSIAVSPRDCTARAARFTTWALLAGGFSAQKGTIGP